jgi:signal transduction histidine kinase
MDTYTGSSGDLSVVAHDVGLRSGVATPIIVQGRLWGVMVAASLDEQPLAPDTEARLASFTELVATAIANAESRSALDASRARIVAAFDEARRRIERDLHDGAQQRLVSLGLTLRAAQTAVPPKLGELGSELANVAEGLTNVVDELRELASGIHPAILAKGGLGSALRTLARRSTVPVELDVQAQDRLPEPVEVATYYVVSEALTNAAKHAQASVVQVEVAAVGGVLRLGVRDDGVGGADPTRGSGLVGLKDRVEALGGTITVQSPPGAGTALQVDLPLDS